MATGLENQSSNYQPMSIGDWIITYIVLYIPPVAGGLISGVLGITLLGGLVSCISFVMLFIWAFGSSTKPSKKTWAQATLIFMAIAIVLAIIFFSVFANTIGNIFSR